MSAWVTRSGKLSLPEMLLPRSGGGGSERTLGFSFLPTGWPTCAGGSRLGGMVTNGLSHTDLRTLEGMSGMNAIHLICCVPINNRV